MKGILHKTEQGWVVIYDEVIGENIVKKNQNSLLLHTNNQNLYEGLIDDSQNEGLEVEFEIFIGYDNNGPEHFPRFARILEEDSLKDWDVTLNDGLEDEPYVSDNFQIGPDGAYEHIEENKTMTPKEKAIELVEKYENECLLSIDNGKVAAVITVDEIINHHSQEQGLYIIDTYYWREVKKEIENL